MKVNFFVLTLLMVLASTSPALAWSPIERCLAENYGDEKSRGRNAWALKCGAIDQEEHDFLNRKRKFVTFSRAQAPYHRKDPCDDGLWGHSIGTCIFGCYVPDQELIFDGRQMAIDEAMQNGAQTVLSLADIENWSDNSSQTANQEIQFFTQGDNRDAVVFIEAAEGPRITVTANHPMVTEDGRVIEAQEVRPGVTVLKGLEGSLHISRVESRDWLGLVLNVTPVSDTTAANLLVAEGFVVGSSRFQNEWRKQEDRLFLRRAVGLPRE